jgi:hypothetical protein
MTYLWFEFLQRQSKEIGARIVVERKEIDEKRG